MGDRREVDRVVTGPGFHWVGDGFNVMQVLPGRGDLGDRISPFLLMDYHAPFDYAPTEEPRGVGVHPHRGFETVTLAFEGAVQHHDSTGAGGIIRAGDAQWMTAASGILHKEYHEREWARTGGRMHMMQLWVNLPAASKMDPPGYQPLLASEMGRVPVDGGTVTVIAGEYRGIRGPAKTRTPINLWRGELEPGGAMDASFPSRHNVAVFVMEGEVVANDTEVPEHHLVLFANEGSEIQLHSPGGAHLLVLEGEPIDEPVVSYGPFVMNTRAQIVEAIEDFENGRFGQLT